MANEKLVKGMIIGAAVGGLVTLLDKETRREVVNKLKSTKQTVGVYASHPSDAMHRIRVGYEDLTFDLSKGIESTLSLLSQIQETLDAISQPKNKRIED